MEISILAFSGVFALIAAVILSSGWGVTCDTIHDLYVYYISANIYQLFLFL